MEHDNDTSITAASADLRRRAEKKLKTRSGGVDLLRSDDETLRLLHELQVHQIELEMQNTELRQARDKIENALETYTDLYDFAPVGYCTLDRKGTILAANLTAAGLLGIERARLIGRIFGTFVAEENRLLFSEFIGRVFTNNGKEICELALAIGTDSRLFMRIEGITCRDGNECRIVFIDINKRTLAEQENRLSRDRLDWVLDKTRIGMWLNELSQGRLCWDAQTMRLFFVRPEEEPTIELFYSRLHPDDREPTRLAVEYAIHNHSQYEIDHRVVDPISGDVHWIHSTGNVTYATDGTPVRFDGINYDITARKRAEEAQHEIEELNRKTLEALPAHIAVIDRQGQIIAVNHAWTEFARDNGADGSATVNVGSNYCHICRQAVKGQDDADAEQALSGIEAILEGVQEQFTMEYPCHSSEQKRWFLMTVVPLGLGGDSGAVITHTDISDRRLTEDALRFLAMYTETGTGENFLRELASYLAQSLSMDFICIDRLKDDQLTAQTLAVFHNGQFEDNLSYTLQDTPCADVIGQSICCFPQNVQRLFPNDTFLKDLQAESYLGTTLWSTEGIPIGLIAVIGRKPLINSRVAQSILQLVAPRAAGELESQLTKQELFESERRFRDIAVISSDWLWDIDKDCRYTFASGRVEEVLGYKPAEIIGRTPFDLMPPDEAERLRNVFMEISARKEPFYDLTNINLHRNGELRHIQTSALPIFDVHGELCGYRGVDKDITARKVAELALQQSHDELEHRIRQRTLDLEFTVETLQIEIAEREMAELALKSEITERLKVMEELRKKEQMLMQQSRLASMGEMINNIAHQWRQPLNVLGLLIQQMQMFYGSSSFSKEYLDTSVNKSMSLINHMSQTIDDFRTFYQPDKEKVEFSIQEVVSRTLTLVEDNFKNHRIGLELCTRANSRISGFPNEFSQALLNILLNAKDVVLERNLDDAKVTVTVGTDDGKVFVTIADNAGGIADNIIGKVFDPYFTTKGPQQGTGIGLFMSKAIIENNMAGRLTVRNTAKGAEFRIEI